MPVTKGSYTSNFTVIPNSTIKDIRLSFEARGVLALMLSMPEDWAMYKSWLCEQCHTTGRDKMTRILKELEINGYLVRVKKRNDSGMFDSYNWFVYPEPYTGNGLAVDGLAVDGLAVDGLAVDGKPVPTKEIDLQKKDNTKEPPVEYEKIKEKYNEILGEQLGKCRDLTAQRKKHIKARINDDKKRLNPEWWENYFYAVGQMDFLIGNSAPNPATGKPWKASFDWLINENNMVKILEGKYSC